MTGTLGEAERKPKTRLWLADFKPLETLRNMAAVVLPPLITIGVLLLVWQVLCSQEGASLPPPSKVLKDTWELIRDPFFDNGGTDVGLFWQILASLKRVGIGFSLAAVCGVALGVLIGQMAVMKITKIADGLESLKAASEIGSHARGGTVRST